MFQCKLSIFECVQVKVVTIPEFEFDTILV